MAVGTIFGRMFSVGVVATLALLGCGAPPYRPQLPPIPAPVQPIPVSLLLVVDDAFPQGERNLIEAAAISLNVQSHGLVTVTTRSGLDPHQFAVPAGAWRLLRILDQDDLTNRFDHRNARGAPDPIVGICVRAGHDLYLVPDRIRTSEQFVSVTMHEILHAVGLGHSSERGSVMFPAVGDRAPVRLTTEDFAALRLTLIPLPPEPNGQASRTHTPSDPTGAPSD